MKRRFNILRLLRKMRFLSEARRLELFPPFWFMGVRIIELKDNWRVVRLKLPLTMFSCNMGDGMFGGHQASVTDPIAALACAKRFPGYEIWSRRHEVDFLLEGNTDLEVRFEFDPAIEEQIRKDLESRGRSTPKFEYGLYRTDGVCCTRVRSTVAIRPKGYRAPHDNYPSE